MTQREKEFIQRELLLDIILESTRYTVEEGDDDPIRTEVIDRYKALCRGGSEVNGMSVRERGMAKSGNRSGQTKDGRMRIMYKGHRITIDKDKLVKEPNMHSRTGYVWKPAPGINLDDYIHPRGVDDAASES